MAELQALLLGTAGMLARAFDDNVRAERLVREALAAAGNEPTAALDELRVRLALSMHDQGKTRQAIAELRTRVSGPDPSPSVLVTLAYLLGDDAAAASRAVV